MLHNVKLIKSKILRSLRISSSEHRIRPYFEKIDEKYLTIVRPEVTSILVSTHGVNMNETYLTTSFGPSRDVVRNAWSLITRN